MARKFLYIILFLVVLVGAGMFLLRIYSNELTQLALVPSGEFAEPETLAPNAYEDPAMWISRPGMGATNDPARWQPAESSAVVIVEGTPAAAAEPAAPVAAPPAFAVFFIHPTSYLDRTSWNAPLDHTESQGRAQLFVRGMGSAFNQASEIWAPRYRQATFGAFLTNTPEAQQAIEAAYRDVELAFDFFLSSVNPETPIVLAGHSQGALHVIRLLAERVNGTELQSRVVMAYPVGWPISVTNDLPSLGLPGCATPQQAGCIVSWSSYAEPADPGALLEYYANSAGLDGQQRGTSPILCVNPVSGMVNGNSAAEQNSGTLVPSDDLTTGELMAGAVPARCDERGLLLIGDPPKLGPFVLPGNNYHVYDIPLFWRDLQQDVVRRVTAWTANRT